MFAGQSAEKELLWLFLPVVLTCYATCGVIAVMLTDPKGRRMQRVQQLLAESFCIDWECDRHTVRRVLKHSNRFAPFAFVLGSALSIFYMLLSV